MSCRIPAIAAAVGGIPEVLANERLGWLIPSADDDALLDAMRQAAVLLEQMGTDARLWIEDHFQAADKWKELVDIVCR